MHRQRIHGRLHSVPWLPPKKKLKQPWFSKHPLHQQLYSLISTSNSSDALSALYTKAFDLCELYKSADLCEIDSEAELLLLSQIVFKSHEFCVEISQFQHANRLIDTKCFREISKLARYWEVSTFMAHISRKYQAISRHIKLELLPAFQSASLPTLPGSPNIRCHVHAEIQLITFYARQQPKLDLKIPRVIGVSKSACYLCSLFIDFHSQFFINRSHGRLYNLWTVPDIFNQKHMRPQRETFRQVINAVNREVCRVLSVEQERRQKRIPRQPLPNESEATLPTGKPRSLLPSEAGTIIAGESAHLICPLPRFKCRILTSDRWKLCPT